MTVNGWAAWGVRERKGNGKEHEGMESVRGREGDGRRKMEDGMKVSESVEGGSRTEERRRSKG